MAETEDMNGASGRWSPDNLREFIHVMLVEMEKRYDGRFADLKESIDARFDEQRNAVTTALNAQVTAMQAALAAADRAGAAAMAAADRAVAKAETATEKRFDGVNEFRQTLADQQRTLMPRSEVTLMINSLEEKIVVMALDVTALKGTKAGIGQGWGYAIGAAGIISVVMGTIVAMVIHFSNR